MFNCERFTFEINSVPHKSARLDFVEFFKRGGQIESEFVEVVETAFENDDLILVRGQVDHN